MFLIQSVVGFLEWCGGDFSGPFFVCFQNRLVNITSVLLSVPLIISLNVGNVCGNWCVYS